MLNKINQRLGAMLLFAVAAALDLLGLIPNWTNDPALPLLLGVVFGTGIVPAAGAVATELTAITRRAFVPKLVVQLYNSSPTMASLLANSQPAYGGISSVSVPVQGAPFVTGQWSDYSGSFSQPSDQQGAFLTEQNLCLFIVPIPFLGMEGVVQLDHAIIPKIEAKMNDATNVTMDTFSTALFNNSSNTSQLMGLPAAIDDGTNAVTYGNISRTTYSWWQSKVYTTSGNPTRQALLQYIAGVTKNGAEKPAFGVCGFGTWALLAQDYVGQEQFVITPGTGFDEGSGPRSAFDALMVAGVPIYADPYMTEGTVYLINSNYLNLYVHVMGSFAFTGFESTLANWQLGYVGALVCILQLVSCKPKTMGRVGGFNSLTL